MSEDPERLLGQVLSIEANHDQSGATIVLARTEITIHKDPKFDFTKLKTFGWDRKMSEVNWFDKAADDGSYPGGQERTNGRR